MTRNNKIVLALAFITGIAFVVLMIVSKQPPQRAEQQTSAIPVRILEVAPQVFRTEARGYGQVLPAQSWKAVANVSGRIVWKHPELESGNLIAAGAQLLQIDPTRYELAEASAKADLAGVEAELRQLNQEESNIRELLALEIRRLTLAQRELDRAINLADQEALSQSLLDEQHRATLQQEQAVQSLNNQLSLIPGRRDTLEARKSRTEMALANARADLDDTRFKAPWDLLVHQTEIENGQHISAGQTLFIADDITQAEATAQLEVAELRRVLSQLPNSQILENNQGSGSDFTNLYKQLALEDLRIWITPTVAPDARWPGTLSRVASSLDPATRTIQAVFLVEEPYRNASPPERPPLLRNMFIQVRISALTPAPVIVVPASSVHQGVVYLMTTNGNLHLQPVSVAWQQGDLAVISEGLSTGDQLVLDDLVPAIEGTPLLPHPVEQNQSFLQLQAEREQQ